MIAHLLSGSRASGLQRAEQRAVPAPACSAASALRGVLPGLAMVTAVASFNLLHRLDAPAPPVWDESYYLTSTARYRLGYASFAAHPPLGLMLIAAGDQLAGHDAHVDWSSMAMAKQVAGKRVPAGFSYFGVRFASALFGILGAALLFLLMARLSGSTVGGLVACSPFLFDTALLAQFRAAQLDSFQICFAVAALLCVTNTVKDGTARPCGPWVFAFGVACGLAAMVRANGVLLLALLIYPLLMVLVRSGRSWAAARAAVRTVACAAGGFILATAAVLIAHVTMADQALPPTWPAARIDMPFIAPAYRAYLAGEQPLSPAVLLAAADGYRRFMAADVTGVGLQDSNGSKPWAWPLGRGPITYAWTSDGQVTSFVALVPNMAAWIVSLAGLAGGLMLLCQRRTGRPDDGDADRPLVAALLATWTVFMVADVMLASIRVMYLYHYFIPLVLGWVLAAIVFGRTRRHRKAVERAATLALLAVLTCFILVSPLALHQPMTRGACRLRMLLNGPALCDVDRPDNGAGERAAA